MDRGVEISNSFHECNSFAQAVKRLRTAMCWEQTQDPSQPFWQEQIDQCDLALAIYRKHYRQMVEAAAQELNDAGLTKFAKALKSGNYTYFEY